MSSSSRDRSADSLFDSFDTPPRPPHASGSRSSAAVVPPAPSRAGYGRVMPSRSTAATGTRTNRRRNRDDASPARSSSSSSSSTRSGFNVDPSSNLTRHHDPSTTVSTGSRLSSPPAGHHYTTGHDPHRDTFQDNDDDHEEDSRSFRDVPDETTSRSGTNDQDDDNDDGAESEESESEVSILHKIGLIPPPSTLPQGNRSGRHRFKVNEGDDGVDEGLGPDGVDEGYRTSWMGPSEVKGMRMGPRLTDRGVGFEGVDHQTYRTIIDHQLVSTSFLFTPGPYLDRLRTTTSNTPHASILGSGRGGGSRMDGRKGLRVVAAGGWMGAGSGVGAEGRFGVGVLPRGG